MSEKIITLTQIESWFEDLDQSLKDKIVTTMLCQLEGRETLYNLYQASQLLRARMLGDFTETVEFNNNRYDS